MAYQFHPLVNAKGCEGKAQAGLVALSQALEEVFPEQGSWGIYNCRNARGQDFWSHHAEGRAYDVGVGRNKALGDAIVKVLLKNAYALGLDHVIWYRRKWSAKYPNGTVYRGSNPTLRHEDHIHVGMHWDYAESMTKETIFKILGDDTDMAILTDSEQKDLQDWLNRLKALGSNPAYISYLIPELRKGLINADELKTALQNLDANVGVDDVIDEIVTRLEDA